MLVGVTCGASIFVTIEHWGPDHLRLATRVKGLGMRVLQLKTLNDIRLSYAACSARNVLGSFTRVRSGLVEMLFADISFKGGTSASWHALAFT